MIPIIGIGPSTVLVVVLNIKNNKKKEF